MKKEAVNTFSEGLNYDLNPLTTPNNILTDCINGTFITFNGDELALQNDAGNTPINVYFDEARYPLYDETVKQLDDIVYLKDINENRTYYKSLINNNGDTPGASANWVELISDVQLTDGFYPLGIKEYGGVLYIVSGSTNYKNLLYNLQENITSLIYGFANEAVQLIEGKTYTFEASAKVSQTLAVGRSNTIIIYNSGWTFQRYLEFTETIDTVKSVTFTAPYTGVYYITSYNYPSLNPNLPPAGQTVTTNWYKVYNYIEKIEFGSYPSPIVLNNTEENDGSTFTHITSDILYTNKIINDNIFRSGEYVTFSGTSSDVSNITYQKFLGGSYQSSTLKIYKVKLNLQLTNGFIDLTDDVWYSYAQFVKSYYNENLNESTIRFWFNDSNFKYYCKSNFKGKLILSVELEDLIQYKLNYYTTENVVDQYRFTFNISFTNGLPWNITKFIISYTLDSGVLTTQDWLIGAPYVLDIPFSNYGKLFEFKITPVFYNPGTTTDITTLLPTTYLDKYTFRGSQLLTDHYEYDPAHYESNEYY